MYLMYIGGDFFQGIKYSKMVTDMNSQGGEGVGGIFRNMYGLQHTMF